MAENLAAQGERRRAILAIAPDRLLHYAVDLYLEGKTIEESRRAMIKRHRVGDIPDDEFTQALCG